jgi:molybdopterin-guanine dinucleotide biosynthesis protein A
MPDLDGATVAALVAAMRADPAVAVATAASEPGDAQPLCAAWRVTLAQPVLSAAFASGERSVRRAWTGLARDTVTVERRRVRNVNSPSELPLDHGNH